MSLLIHNIFDGKQRKYGTSGTAFTQDFIDATNYVTNDWNEMVGASVEAITSTNDTIDLDAVSFQPLYSMGIDFYMSGNGHWEVENARELERKYDRLLQQRWQRYQCDNPPATKLGDLS